MVKRTRRRRRSRRRRRGGSVVGALRTALLPFLLYKGQKKMQKRVSRRKRRKTKATTTRKVIRLSDAASKPVKFADPVETLAKRSENTPTAARAKTTRTKTTRTTKTATTKARRSCRLDSWTQSRACKSRNRRQSRRTVTSLVTKPGAESYATQKRRTRARSPNKI